MPDAYQSLFPAHLYRMISLHKQIAQVWREAGQEALALLEDQKAAWFQRELADRGKNNGIRQPTPSDSGAI
jgi:hypothetical protein